MEWIPQPGGARALLEAHLPAGAVALAWLGQAGFALRAAGQRVLIDPYLSDYLARKYAGTEFSHQRMMPPPVRAEEILELDWVFCSHRHSDHADPGSLPTLAANNPRCRFVVPRAELEFMANLDLPRTRLLPANAGDTIRASDSLVVHLVPSAHETLRVNSRGEHHFLGFILALDTLTLYHSGDCVVYEGLADQLRPHRIDLALLPVNGRRAALTSRGILGNMTFEEARSLCLAAGIGAIVPHHFGMFAFNTVDPAALQRQAARPDFGLRCLLPSVESYYLFPASTPTSASSGSRSS